MKTKYSLYVKINLVLKINSPRKCEKQTLTETPSNVPASRSLPSLPKKSNETSRAALMSENTDLDYLIDQIDNLPRKHFLSRLPGRGQI